MILLWPWMSADAMLETFLPTALQAEGLLAVLASGLVMVMLGRLILGSRALPEIALIAGWGAVSLVLTLWGASTQETMRIPAAALVGVAAIGAFVPRGRLAEPDLVALGRLLLVALPLIAVLAAAWPSGPDTFTNQLPNAAYLYDYGQFPATNRPPMLALWPAFPYNLQLAAFLPALLVPAFPPNVLTHVNLLLQMALALLLARSMRGPQALSAAAPNWAAIGGGILLTTFLNPGFDPKIQFSGYGDPTIAVALAFAAWQAERLLAALAGDRSVPEERLGLVLVLLAGAAIKQVSIFLMGSVVLVAFLLGAFDKRIGPARALSSLTVAFLPAILLIGVWRFYVATHFAPDDELRFLPMDQWSLANIPAILSNMGYQIWQRLPFFVLLYGVSLSAIPMVLRRGLTPAARLFLLTLGVTLLYTAFLTFTYVAHFPGRIGASAHSFFRYNTHLGLLATLAIVVFARESWIRRGAPDLGRGWGAVAVAAIVLAVAAPIASAGWTRADRRQPQPDIWNLATWVAPYLNDGDRVALLLPGDNRSVALMLRVAIAISPPYRALADFTDISRDDLASLQKARKDGNDFALISCVSKPLSASPEGQALKLHAGQPALLAANGNSWKLITTEPFLTATAPENWTTELSPGPFCQ
jgi:hypothetical protein